MNEHIEKIANLIMIEYYLANELNIDFDFSLDEATLLSELNNDYVDLSKSLDEYIKLNDWTGLLGDFGSGQRERSFAIEGILMNYEGSKLEERAIELDANGKPYAVQDITMTQKTHNALGNKDYVVKNGLKDPNLTATEKDITIKAIDQLKKMGKIKDVNSEFNISHGPDFVYMPIEDKVKVTPDNGDQPYKIKIPECVRPILSDILKPYDYDILDDFCAILNKELFEECLEALKDKCKITETIKGKDVRKYGYLENEAIILKLEENN